MVEKRRSPNVKRVSSSAASVGYKRQIPAFAIEVEDIVARDSENVSDAFIHEAVAKKLSNGHLISPNALRCTDDLVCTAYANKVYPVQLGL